MASKVCHDEEEKDFLICGICMEYYDAGPHTPKILVCFHSCCITCLKSQAVNSIITCPFCREETRIKNGVENMTTNFYIMPKVQKVLAKRKQIEEIIAKTKENLAKSITMRRQVLSKFKTVQSSLKVIENLVREKSDDNNEKIAILQSLLEDPTSKVDIDDILASDKKFLSELEQSEQELQSTETLNSNISEVEKFICCYLLKNKTNGSSFKIKAWENKAITFDNKSAHGTTVGAFQSIMAFILYNMKEQKFWNASEDDSNQACAVVPNGKHVTPLSSDSYLSTSDSESSSVQRQHMCYMHFKINGTVQPKVVFSLDVEEAPIMCRHFMEYCQGTKNLTYRNTRIFMTKAGEFITGGNYEDLKLVDPKNASNYPPHERNRRYLADQSTLDEMKGALRMRHRGRCEGGVYVSSEFSVLCHDHPNNNQMTTVFGYVRQGMEVCEAISRLDPVENNIIIQSCGPWSD